MAASTQRWLERNGPLLVASMAVVAGLIGVFDRSLAFHDEILNTSKAMRMVVVDYAMRPVLYGINVVAIRLFGNHTYALVMLSLISLVITALCLYDICTRYFSAAIGFLSVFTYLSVDMVRHFGVRAMPHMNAGMFTMLSLCCALACFSETQPRKQRMLAFAAGFLAIVSFSTHPTMAGYLVGLCTWAAMTWFLSLSKRTSQSPFACTIRPALWIAIGVATALASLFVIYAIWYHESYLTAWISFAKLPQGPEHARDITFFYVHALLNTSSLPVALLIGAILIMALQRFTNRAAVGEVENPKGRAFALGMPLYCLIVGTAMVSLNQWEHPRLLVSYVPFVSLSFACWFAAASGVVRAWLPQTWSRVLLTTVVVAVAVTSVSNVHRAAVEDKKQDPTTRQDYLAFYEALRNIRDPRIGVLSGREGLVSKVQFFNAAGLEWVSMKPNDEVAKFDSLEILRAHLIDLEIRYLYWDLHKTTSEEYAKISKDLRAIGGGISYKWRPDKSAGRRGEIWFVQLSSDTFQTTFSKLKHGTKIGIFGEPNELSPSTNYWLTSLLQSHKLNSYTLNVRQRTPARQLYYLMRNHVEYVVMPLQADHLVSQDKISAMELMLQEIGANKLEQGEMPKLQLWHLADLANAKAAADIPERYR